MATPGEPGDWARAGGVAGALRAPGARADANCAAGALRCDVVRGGSGGGGAARALPGDEEREELAGGGWLRVLRGRVDSEEALGSCPKRGAGGRRLYALDRVCFAREA